MQVKLRMMVLLVLVSLACYSAAGAARSLQSPLQRLLPEEVYESLSRSAPKARFYLGGQEGYVAVFQGKRDRLPLALTGIELQSLRLADRAMLEKGIPVSDERALLQLLEDLGS